MLADYSGSPLGDHLTDGIDDPLPKELPVAQRGLYADAHADFLISLEAIDRDIQHHQVEGNKAAVSRLRLEEARIKFWLNRFRDDAVADFNFAVRSSIVKAENSLPNAIMEVLQGRVATKQDIEEIKAGMRVIGQMLTGGKR